MTLSKKETHDLNDQGSVVTSWNQFCFTGGYFEVGVTLPGLNRVAELWPVVWAMKNLGRAGHSVNLEGMVRLPIHQCGISCKPYLLPS